MKAEIKTLTEADEKEFFELLKSTRLCADAAYLTLPQYIARGISDGERLIAACVTLVSDDADLCEIAVAEDWRRKGLGGIMLADAKVESRKRGAKRMLLEVRVSNKAARGLYENSDFEMVGTRKNYYPDGEDAAIYRCDFPNAIVQ